MEEEGSVVINWPFCGVSTIAFEALSIPLFQRTRLRVQFDYGHRLAFLHGKVLAVANTWIPNVVLWNLEKSTKTPIRDVLVQKVLERVQGAKKGCQGSCF